MIWKLIPGEWFAVAPILLVVCKQLDGQILYVSCAAGINLSKRTKFFFFAVCCSVVFLSNELHHPAQELKQCSVIQLPNLQPPLSHLHSQPLLTEARHHHISLTGIPTTPYFYVAIPWWIPSEFERVWRPSVLPDGGKREFSWFCLFLSDTI